MLRMILAICLIAPSVQIVLAQDSREEPGGAPPPPPIREPLPPKVAAPDDEVPEVIIRREDDRIVEEYRVAGRITMIRVTPTVGPVYYLIDTTGDGVPETKSQELMPVKPVHFPIVEW